MIRPTFIGAAMLLGALTGGCSDDFTMDIRMESDPPIGVDVSVAPEQVRLQDGIAVAVLVRPLEDDEKMDWETELELVTTNPGVITIGRLEFDELREEQRDHDLRDGDWRFLLEGQREGRADIEVWADEELRAEIPVVVTEQSVQ